MSFLYREVESPLDTRTNTQPTQCAQQTLWSVPARGG